MTTLIGNGYQPITVTPGRLTAIPLGLSSARASLYGYYRVGVDKGRGVGATPCQDGYRQFYHFLVVGRQACPWSLTTMSFLPHFGGVFTRLFVTYIRRGVSLFKAKSEGNGGKKIIASDEIPMRARV